MRNRIFAALLLTTGAFGQPLRTPATGPIEIDPTKPKEVVARLDGKDVTAEEFQQIVVSLDTKTREATANNPEEILRYQGWLNRISAESERRGLAGKEPLRTQLELARIQLLSNAIIQKHELDEVVTPFDQRGYYQANLPAYTAVRLKLIYLPFATETEELQAKRKMEQLHKQLVAGTPFVNLVRQHSRHEESKAKDGDYGEVRMADQIPQPVKDAAFRLKDGAFSAPVRLANGYYLFQRTGSTVDPYESVSDKIFTEIKQKRNLEWVSKHREAVKVEMKQAAGSAPDRVVAVLDGAPVTAAEVDALLGAMEERLRTNLKESPEEMLRGIGFMRRMAKLAEDEKLGEQAPYKGQLEMVRHQALTNALIQDIERTATISDAAVAAAYKDNLAYVSAAKVKIVFVPVTEDNEAGNAAALSLAKDIHEKITGGADFVEMVRQYSKDPVSRDKDGDYGPLKITDDIPQPAKQAIWTMKLGQVSPPVRLPNGYYIFKLLSLEEPGLAAVKDDLAKRMRAALGKQTLNAMRAGVQVEILAKRATAKQ